jgi:CheY-like chemotaxis protein
MSGEILLVDDDEDDRALTRRQLERQGPQPIREACSGREAIRALSETTPDVMILDAKMPDVDGLAVVEWMTRNRALVPTVMLTGHGESVAHRLPPWVLLAMKPASHGVLIRAMDEAARLLSAYIGEMESIRTEACICVLADRIEEAATRLERRRHTRRIVRS